MRGYPRFVPLDLRGGQLSSSLARRRPTFLHNKPRLIGNNPILANYHEQAGDTVLWEGAGLGGGGGLRGEGGGAYKMVECMGAFVIHQGSQALRPQT